MTTSVLHVFQPYTEGVPRYVQDLASLQQSRGDNVRVACHPDADLDDSGDFSRVDWHCSEVPLQNVRSDRQSLQRIIEKVAPDVTHLHSSHAGLAGRFTIAKRPTIFQPHAWSFKARQTSKLITSASLAWERLAAMRTDCWLTDSLSERTAGIEAGLPAERIELGGRMVDTGLLEPTDASEARRSLGIDDIPTVLAIGRMATQKGMDVLVNAWKRTNIEGWQLVLVGDGPLFNDIQEAASGSPSIKMVGTQADCNPWYRAADIFALASRWEGGSLAVVEAISCGLPLVVTDVEGMREAVETMHGDAGLVVPTENPAAMAAALERILSDDSYRSECSERARTHAVDSFSPDAMYKRVNAAYKTALERHR